MNLVRRRLVLVLFLMLAQQAHANLTIYPMRTAVEAQSDTQIRVYSQSAQTQFVQVSIRRIDNASQADEREVNVDVGDAAIAVTPAKFALSGASNRLVRVIALHPVLQETAYRVSFESIRSDEGYNAVPLVHEADASLGVNIIWGALVNVLPLEGQVDFRLTEAGVHNAGTLRAGITSISDCNGADCTRHDVTHSLYPGAHLVLPFALVSGHEIQLRYTLTRDGHHEHMQTLTP